MTVPILNAIGSRPRILRLGAVSSSLPRLVRVWVLRIFGSTAPVSSTKVRSTHVSAANFYINHLSPDKWHCSTVRVGIEAPERALRFGWCQVISAAAQRASVFKTTIDPSALGIPSPPFVIRRFRVRTKCSQCRDALNNFGKPPLIPRIELRPLLEDLRR